MPGALAPERPQKGGVARFGGGPARTLPLTDTKGGEEEVGCGGRRRLT